MEWFIYYNGLRHKRVKSLHIKNSTTKIAHFNTFHFSRYVHFRPAKYLFTNIQKQQNTLKSTLLFRTIENVTGEVLENC